MSKEERRFPENGQDTCDTPNSNRTQRSKTGSKKGGSRSRNSHRQQGSKQRKERKPQRYEDITSNNIEWWNKSTLYPLSTSIQYNAFPGYIYDQDLLHYAGTLEVQNELGGTSAAYPGIMTIRYVPTLGSSQNFQSPVNLAFTSLWTELAAHTNSGNLGFQSPDLANITLALNSLIALIAECERVLGLTNLYFRENAYFPEGVIEALGYDFEDIKKNKANYVLRLQSIIQNFNAISVPDYMDYFKRAMQLNRNIYMDEDHIQSQIYAFQAEGYYSYNEKSGGMLFKTLKFDGVRGHTMSLNYTLLCLEEELQNLRAAQDLGDIIGAIRRSFPDTALIALDIPTSADVTMPVYDRNVTWQVNNMDWTGTEVGGLNVEQDPVTAQLYQQPMAKYYFEKADITNSSFEAIFAGMPSAANNHVINSYDNTIGNEFVMESTRLMFNLSEELENPAMIAELYDESTKIMSVPIDVFGTEICTTVTITVAYKLPTPGDSDGTNPGVGFIKVNVPPVVAFNITTNSTRVFLTGSTQLANVHTDTMTNALTKFNNHPRNYYTSYDNTLKNIKFRGFTGDLSTFTTISRSQLGYIHLAALQSVYLITVSGGRTI